MPTIKIGALCWNQYADWPSLLQAGIRADEVGYDSLWTWDHLYPIVGDSTGPNYEGWLTITAWAQATKRVTVGLMVGANGVPRADAHGEDGDDARPHQRRPRDPRHRRRVVRGGARGLRARLRVRVPRAAALAGRGAAGHARHARRHGADGAAARHYTSKRHAQPAGAAPATTSRSASAAAASR